MREAQVAHRRRGVEAGADLVERLLRLAVHARPVDEAQARHAAHRLAADEDVLGRGQLVEHHRFLVHRDDAGLACLPRAVEAAELAAHAQLALGRRMHAGQDLDQRRLARAVLADERHHFAGHQVEVDAAQRVGRAEALVQAAQAQHGVAGSGCHEASRHVASGYTMPYIDQKNLAKRSTLVASYVKGSDIAASLSLSSVMLPTRPIEIFSPGAPLAVPLTSASAT